MARRTPQGRGFARPFKPSGGWSGSVIAPFVVAAASKILVVSFAAPAQSFTLTIRRIRMQIAWGSDQSAAIEEPFGAIGAAVLSDNAIASGVANLPDPFTDVSDDIWMMHQPLVYFGSQGQRDTSNEWDVDSKAMRKVADGYALAFIIANGSATDGARAQVTIRLYSTQTRA